MEVVYLCHWKMFSRHQTGKYRIELSVGKVHILVHFAYLSGARLAALVQRMTILRSMLQKVLPTCQS